MDSYHRIAVSILRIKPIHSAQHLGNRPTGLKVIAHHVNADLLVWRVIGVDRSRYTLYRTTITIGAPVTQRVNDSRAPRGRVWNPLTAEGIEHIVAHIIHDLDSLDVRIDV